MSPRFLRFLAVGSGTTILNLGLLWLLVDGLGVHYLAACTVSFFALNALGYVLHKGLTFRQGLDVVAPEMLRYFLVMAASLGLNLLLMALLVRGLSLHYLWASVLVTVLLTLFNYLSHRDLTFRVEREGREGPPRLLQLSAFFRAHGGGIEVVADELAQRLTRQGFEVHWMAGGRAEELPAHVTPGLRVSRPPNWDPLERRIGLPFPLWGWTGMRQLWQAVGWSDGLQVHDYLYLPHLLAIVFARMRGRPIVLTQHIGPIPFKSAVLRGVLAALNRSLGRLALLGASQVIFVGRPVQQYFEAFLRPARPTRLIPNGVDHERFQPVQELPPGPTTRLLFVGRFVEKKGLGLIRETLGRVDAEWTFVGWGPMDPGQWPESARARCRVLGRVAPADMAPHYGQADLLVLPSTGEGFPLVLQEALACGTPVLVSTEVFEAFPKVDPACVFHVELRGLIDPAAALTERLRELLASPGTLAEARRHAAALARQWSWDQCSADYADLWRDLMRRPPTPDSIDSHEPQAH